MPQHLYVYYYPIHGYEYWDYDVMQQTILYSSKVQIGIILGIPKYTRIVFLLHHQNNTFHHPNIQPQLTIVYLHGYGC